MAFKMNPKSPLLKATGNFTSPAQKALKGDQHKLPDHLKSKIEASPGKKDKFTPGSNKPGESMTAYSTKEVTNLPGVDNRTSKTGTIHGPKVSYDMAYKNRGEKYKDMDKASYVKEAKRQTKSFTGTGDWDAPKKKRKKVESVKSTIKTSGIKNVAPKNSVKSEVTIKKVVSKKPDSKGTTRAKKRVSNIRERGANVVSKIGNAAKAGKDKKVERLQKRAQRLKKREARVEKRVARRSKKDQSPAKILGAVAGALGKAVVGKVVDKAIGSIGKKKASPAKSFKGLVSKLERQGKSKEAATKIAGAVANAKMKGAGSGPTAAQKARAKK
ncbi:MAG: hypothetical protein CMO51_04365 [Verrucomicrobiales bacterium]|nr:hypothetical protein [Verrucomicrobiales bacterium]